MKICHINRIRSGFFETRVYSCV